jgi:hypothetical protein
MSSRFSDPQDPREPFDRDPSTHQTPTPNHPEPSRKRFPRPRLLPLSQTETTRKRSTTLRLPALDPETFHTRRTAPRFPTLGQPESADDADFDRPPSEADLLFISRSGAPRAPRPERWKAPLQAALRGRVALLLLAFLVMVAVLVAEPRLIIRRASDCGGAQARQQRCFVRSLFPALSDSSEVQPTATPTATAAKPKPPAIPNDLPDNVHAFITIALPYALQAHQVLKWQTSVLLAQWGFEHGWSVPDSQGYNWGNTTYAPGCQYQQGSRFCYAPTPAEGLREYVYTAQLGYYDGVRTAVVHGADATALALGQSPWDGGHYGGDQPGSALLGIMHDFNLYRFDPGG